MSFMGGALTLYLIKEGSRPHCVWRVNVWGTEVSVSAFLSLPTLPTEPRPYIFFFFETRSGVVWSSWTQTQCILEGDPELLALLTPLNECWLKGLH